MLLSEEVFRLTKNSSFLRKRSHWLLRKIIILFDGEVCEYRREGRTYYYIRKAHLKFVRGDMLSCTADILISAAHRVETTYIWLC